MVKYYCGFVNEGVLHNTCTRDCRLKKWRGQPPCDTFPGRLAARADITEQRDMDLAHTLWGRICVEGPFDGKPRFMDGLPDISGLDLGEFGEPDQNASESLKRFLAGVVATTCNVDDIFQPLPVPGELEEHQARLTQPVMEFLKLIATESPDFRTLEEIQLEHPLTFTSSSAILRNPYQKMQPDIELKTLLLEGISLILMGPSGTSRLLKLKAQGVRILAFTDQDYSHIINDLRASQVPDDLVSYSLNRYDLTHMPELLAAVTGPTSTSRPTTALLERGGLRQKFCMAHGIPSITTSLFVMTDSEGYPEILDSLLAIAACLKAGDHLGIDGPIVNDRLEMAFDIENIPGYIQPTTLLMDAYLFKCALQEPKAKLLLGEIKSNGTLIHIFHGPATTAAKLSKKSLAHADNFLDLRTHSLEQAASAVADYAKRLVESTSGDVVVLEADRANTKLYSPSLNPLGITCVVLPDAILGQRAETGLISLALRQLEVVHVGDLDYFHYLPQNVESAQVLTHRKYVPLYEKPFSR